ncbi:30S ribosomal protein S27ae [Candidatus Woesearchaeota archaeon]|nr:30S ribosomal protein S27ae [Candidatus Woesearchaeota archaeon]MCF7901004.1 30S ribosomal protein S27ae [Candidatus Woesearchaeota archaeon]MCF8013280.1 30S ribosomal protein S27ae [Candidatus Woesearchaeota archaeon]
MAAKKGGKPAPKGGAAPKKKKSGKPIHTLYENGKAKNLSCPKCGPGIFLAAHKDRASCGKCGYMEKK